MENIEWAIKNGELRTVEELVCKDCVDVNAEVKSRNLLHYAADFGQDEVLKFLIDKGADVNAVDKYGITPLLAAIFEDHEKCVKILLSNGASKEGTAPDGKSYLECANECASDQVKELLK